MSVPLHTSRDGLPIGAHFTARPGHDAMLLALAYELETARPWVDRWPPFSAPLVMA
jgi:amidase